MSAMEKLKLVVEQNIFSAANFTMSSPVPSQDLKLVSKYKILFRWFVCHFHFHLPLPSTALFSMRIQTPKRPKVSFWHPPVTCPVPIRVSDSLSSLLSLVLVNIETVWGKCLLKAVCFPLMPTLILGPKILKYASPFRIQNQCEILYQGILGILPWLYSN